MLRNYLLITLRLIWRNKFFSFLNIIGLALGMATALIIFQYISFENSFDNFHRQKDSIFLISQKDTVQGTISSTFPPIVASLLKQNFAEVESAVRIVYEKGAISNQSKNQVFNEHWAYTDQDFFKLFDFEVLRGDKNQVFDRPNQVAISKTYAQKYFAKQNPMNQILILNDQFGEHICIIKAVFEDIPDNSHIQSDVLVSLSSLKNNGQNWAKLDGWTWGSFYTYLKLIPTTNLHYLKNQIQNSAKKEGIDNFQINFISLSDIHLYESNQSGNIQVILVLGFVAAFILLLAWINYINLTTSKAIRRAKEIGVRKVAGAQKFQLVKQFLLEAFILNFLALLLAFLIADLALPFIKALIPTWSEGNFSLSFIQVLIIICCFVLGTFFSGLYPAFILSNYKPIQVLKGNFATASQKGLNTRKVLIILQFSISIALLIATLGIYTQISFMMGQKLGMNIDEMLVLKAPTVTGENAYQNSVLLKNKLQGFPEIKQVSTTGSVPSKNYNWGSASFRPIRDRSKKKYQTYTYYVDGDFVETYQLKLLVGNSGKQGVKKKSKNIKVLLNESARKLFGFKTAQAALGNKLTYTYDKEAKVEVIGVVADYHHYSLKDKIEPVIFYLNQSDLTFSLKLNLSQNVAQDISSLLKKIENEYKKFFRNSPFEYYFLSDAFDRQYDKEQKFAKLLGLFTLLALIIAGMGLYALAMLATTQRSKEIGIRKVLGASIQHILFRLTWSFLRLVLLASIFALPVAYFFIQNWLQNFAYQMKISIFLFIFPLLFVLVFTTITIAYHVLQVAYTNPVKSLKYE